MNKGIVSTENGKSSTLDFANALQRLYIVLPRSIQLLQSKGYKLVTVAECLGMEPYQSVGQPGMPDVSSFYLERYELILDEYSLLGGVKNDFY